ncbi:hypothetical protein [Nitrosococcus halophilus]|uniref:hypothetical protein n=1 Tax=Nitrosococcus halophilus TaxID=133539 RepID=UPI000303F97E
MSRALTLPLLVREAAASEESDGALPIRRERIGTSEGCPQGARQGGRASTLQHQRYIEAATAENTRRAYRSAIRHFERWGGRLPAEAPTVRVYCQTSKPSERSSPSSVCENTHCGWVTE